MKNNLILSFYFLLVTQVGFSVHQKNVTIAIDDLSFSNKIYKCEDQVTARKIFSLDKVIKIVSQLKARCKQILESKWLGKWTLILLGIGLLSTAIGIPLLFIGSYGSSLVLILAYILFFGGLATIGISISWGILWLISKITTRNAS